MVEMTLIILGTAVLLTMVIGVLGPRVDNVITTLVPWPYAKQQLCVAITLLLIVVLPVLVVWFYLVSLWLTQK